MNCCVQTTAHHAERSEVTARTIGHYRIVQKLASGGMGDVFIAEDTQLGREVALKMLLPDLGGDADQRNRLTREAKALAALNHPNIVTVHSVEQADGVAYITMELVKGRTLAELIPTSGVDLATFFRIAIPLVDALAAAHQHGIVHRDIKPSNVMVASDGRVKVLDFGIARPTTAATAASNEVTASIADLQLAGTPAYMSPEQAEGRTVDARSDIFSLGVLFHEMLSGQRPFRGDTAAATIAAVLTATPRLLTEVNANIPRAQGTPPS